MKNYFLKTLGVSLILLLINSCSDDDFSGTPHIDFVEITPTQVVSFQDKVTITISYKDGDGDLGENDPDVTNLYVTDSRNQVTFEYRISQLSPVTDIAIQGDLDIELPAIAILNETNSTENLSFEVYMEDRAGNLSNTITTSEIVVTKE